MFLASLSSKRSLPLSPLSLEALQARAIREARHRRDAEKKQRDFYEKYGDDPVLFGEEVLGEQYTDDVKQMMYSVRDYPVTIAKSGNSVGKTHAAARIALWWYKCHPGAQVYVTAAPPASNLKRQLWGELDSVVRKKPDLFKDDRITSMTVQAGPLSFIAGVAIPMSGTAEERQAKFAGKHAPYLLFIVDEGDAVPEEVYLGIESCLTGGVGRLLIMFNPRAESGPVYEMEKTGRARVLHLSALRHPNVVTGEQVIPGAVDRDVTVRRINLWTRPRLSDEAVEPKKVFMLPDYLDGAETIDLAGNPLPPLQIGERVITHPAFYYMVLGEYPAEGADQIIPMAWIRAAQDRWRTWTELTASGSRGRFTGIGCDVGGGLADSDASTLATCYDHVKVLDVRPYDQGDPERHTMELVGKIVGLLRANTGSRAVAVIDAIGVGLGVLHRLREQGFPAIGFDAGRSTNLTDRAGEMGFADWRSAAWWLYREILEPGSGFDACLPPIPELEQELAAPRWERLSNGKIRVESKKSIRKRIGRSTDYADAVLHIVVGPLLWEEAMGERSASVGSYSLRIGEDY